MEARKRKVYQKSPRKATLHTSSTKPAKKKQNNGILRTAKASKSKKTDKKKKKTPVLVELSVDPPLLSKLALSQCRGRRSESGALNFWKFVDAYTSVITKEDINYLNSLTKVYTKENCPFMNMITPSRSSNTSCSPDFPEDWVERIVGALVDPDLFTTEDEDPGSKRMRTDDLDSKRLKLCDPIESMGVFNDRSNFSTYLNMGSVCLDDEEEEMMTNCDMKSNLDESDEVSEEILKCQEELRFLCRQNEKTLSLLSSRAQRQLETQQLKQSLGLCENELVKSMQQKHKEQRLKKGDSMSKKLKDEEKALLQRRELLLTSLEDKQV